MATPVLEALRPKPFRGDVIAAGVVVLTTLVWLLQARFDDEWGAGVHLLYAGLAAGFVGVLAVLSPMERETPRAYQSVLYVATFALALATLLNLADVLGADGLDGRGARTWVFAALAGVGGWFAVHRTSAVCALLAALAGGVAVLSLIQWIFDSDGAQTVRWIFLGLVGVFVIAALGQRDRRRSHAVALVDAAGTAVVAIGLTLFLEAFLRALGPGDTGSSAGLSASWGWQLVLLAGGFGLIAYSSVDRERGPAWLGAVALAEFVLLASSGDLVGWPIVLLLIAALLLVIGLRPTTPAPPPPDADVPPAPTAPLR